MGCVTNGGRHDRKTVVGVLIRGPGTHFDTASPVEIAWQRRGIDPADRNGESLPVRERHDPEPHTLGTAKVMVMFDDLGDGAAERVITEVPVGCPAGAAVEAPDSIAA